MALVGYEVKEGVAWLTLSNPPANTYSYEMMRELDEATQKARFDDAVHVLVLTGEGDKFFCAGADIEMLQQSTPSYKYNFCLHANETLLRLEHTAKLVIAALNGHTVGGGFEVAMACDLRVAAQGPGKIGLPEVNLGVLPGTGGTTRLPRLVGKARALEMMINGRLLGFAEARELGLVHQVFEPGNFPKRVQEYAQSFCPPRRASFAIGRIKRAVQSSMEIPLEHALAHERELQAELFASEDCTEGLAAYLEKREPKFKGR